MAIQLAYLTDEGLNYLIKMRDDTLFFNELFIKEYFNFSETNCDPFLIQTSVLPKKKIVAGGGIRSLQKKKNENKEGDSGNKITIPLDDQTIQKAKACQEMIMYEKVDDGMAIDTNQIKQQNQLAQESFLAALGPNEDRLQPLSINEAKKESTDDNLKVGRLGSGDSFMKKKEPPIEGNNPVIESQQFDANAQPSKQEVNQVNGSADAQPVVADPAAQPSAADQGLYLTHFKGNLSGFKAHFVEYLWSVPETIKQSFHGVEACLTAMEGGCHQQFLRLANGGAPSEEVRDTIGLACINIDHTCLTERRAYIRHLSTVDLSKFEEALQLVLKHAWTVLKAGTVRVDLHHFQDTSKPDQDMQADKEIKAILGMNRRGFKWKTLINDPSTGKRYQIMQIVRPADLKDDQGPPPEPLILKAAQLYDIGSDQSNESQTRSLDEPDVPYCFFAALKKIKEDKQIDSY